VGGGKGSGKHGIGIDRFWGFSCMASDWKKGLMIGVEVGKNYVDIMDRPLTHHLRVPTAVAKTALQTQKDIIHHSLRHYRLA